MWHLLNHLHGTENPYLDTTRVDKENEKVCDLPSRRLSAQCSSSFFFKPTYQVRWKGNNFNTIKLLLQNRGSRNRHFNWLPICIRYTTSPSILCLEAASRHCHRSIFFGYNPLEVNIFTAFLSATWLWILVNKSRLSAYYYSSYFEKP
jgi:hypothetical protein